MSACPRLLACALVCAVLASPLAVSQTGAAAPATPRTAAGNYPDGRDTPLGASLLDLLQRPEIAAAHWGVAVTTLDGTPVFGWNEGQLFRPASTVKLFTAAAALALLGPDHTVSTVVTGDLDQGTGTVTGDLSLVGGGDPGFGTADLPYARTAATSSQPDQLGALADRLVTLGVHHVRGDIVGDDTLFLQEPPPEGWAAEDLVWGYGALPSALSFGDNELRLRVLASPLEEKSPAAATKAPARESATVVLEQRVPFTQVEPSVVLLPTGSPEGRHIAVIAGTSPESLHVFGTMPAGSAPDIEEVALRNPAAYAAAALKQVLEARGVEVEGTARAIHSADDEARPYLRTWQSASPGEGAGVGQNAGGLSQKPDCLGSPPALQVRTLLSIPSARLRDEVVFMLKTSANLHAEMLLRQLALNHGCRGALAVRGAARVRSWLLGVAIPEHDFVFFDGSGLSTKDLVTPRAEVQLLSYAAAQPWSALWKSALPVGGVDGTLAARFNTPTMRGRVMAKTGTLGESRALAGYVRCASGRELIFSILVDDHEPGNSADRTAMDAIVSAIATTQ